MNTLTLLALFAISFGASQSEVIEVKVLKNLANGDPLTDLTNAPVATIDLQCSFGQIKNDPIKITFEPLNKWGSNEVGRVFLANEMKNIVELKFSGDADTFKAEMLIYEHPYNLTKTVDVSAVFTQTGNKIKGRIPKAQLPRMLSRLGSALQYDDIAKNETVYLSYYGLKNFLISLPDLRVVENYQKYKCGNV